MHRRFAWLSLILLALIVLAAAGALIGRLQRRRVAEREARQAVYLYIQQTERYSAPELWGTLPLVSPRTLTQTCNLLSRIIPPPEMEEAHGELVEGYRFIFGGQKIVLQGHGDGVLRSEGEFMISWGLARVREHYRLIREYQEKNPP